MSLDGSGKTRDALGDCVVGAWGENEVGFIQVQVEGLHVDALFFSKVDCGTEQGCLDHIG